MNISGLYRTERNPCQPLAVARYIAALVNGNRVMDTHIWRRCAPRRLGSERAGPITAGHKVAVAAIKEGIRRVVYERSGTAVSVFTDLDPSITTGGKTGTAR